MFAANTYRIRLATDADADTLRRFAEFDSGRPLAGRVLVGQIADVPAAALSLRDGRVLADPSRRSGHLLANLRVRADAVRAYETTPSLRERLLAGLPASYRAQTGRESGSITPNGHVEHPPVLADLEPRSLPSPLSANGSALSTV